METLERVLFLSRRIVIFLIVADIDPIVPRDHGIGTFEF